MALKLSSEQMKQLEITEKFISELTANLSREAAPELNRCSTCSGTCKDECTGCHTCMDTSKAG